MLSADDPLNHQPRRIAVAGVSGSGKTTLCTRVARTLDLPRVELDSLYHGPGWVPRESFVDEVDHFTSGPRWVVELQYRQVRPMIVSRADTLLWLDYPVAVSMARLVSRTVTRRLRRTELWNGNTEPPLRSIFTDRDHILRFGWRTRHKLRPVIPTLEHRFPGLTVVRFTRPHQVKGWVDALPRVI